MPTNLNALIRYKQIDRCLRNIHKRFTIKMLQDECSEALAEHRGIYKKVAERTIRDDIRVMKSDMLGFNAPIEVEGGFYYYRERGYSIFNTTINEKEILKQVYSILLEVRDTLIGKDFLYVLKEIAGMTGEELPRDIRFKLFKQEESGVQFMAASKPEKKYKGFEHLSLEPEPERDFIYEKRVKKMEFSWKRILELI
jgi:hypothetical protein